MSVKHRGFIRPHETLLGVLYRLTDAVVVVGSLIVLAHFGPYPDGVPLSFLCAISVAVYWPVADYMKLYRSWRTSEFAELAGAVTIAWSISLSLVILIGSAVLDISSIEISFAVNWYFQCLTALLIWRLAFRAILMILRQRGFNTRSAVIIGANDLGREVARQIRQHDELGIRLIGFYDDRRDPRRTTDLETEGQSDRALELARTGEVDVVFITFPMRAESRIQDLLQELADGTSTVYIVPNFFAHDLLSSRWHTVGDIQALSIYDTPTAGLGGGIKRAEDIVLSLALLIVFAIPMVLIALAIRLTSPGSALFVQERYGLGRRKICVLKFRTMYVMEDGGDIVQAKRGDSRITPLGRWLRTTSLDELPQIINVLAGSMSLVGPRPHAVAHNESYRKNIHGYMLRHKVKPGLTGWAQINGFRGETDTMEKMEHRVRHDLEYINHWSLWLDFKIIILTVLKGTMFHKNAH